MTQQANFNSDVLKIDATKEIERIIANIRRILTKVLHRRGLVVALSGGIDSSVTTALAAKALGSQRVLALLMPERHSSPETLDLSKQVVESLNVPFLHEDISKTLSSVGFYHRYDKAIQRIIPEYGEGWKSKIVISNVLESRGINVFSAICQGPDGQKLKKRLPLNAYLEVVAATNFKQRIRKMMEYYHADRLHYAVAGTPNRLEFDQGFFVKLGDGASDLKPIAHLYKSQVYQLAKELDIPHDVCQRPPTTDTYSLPQGQDEFYFSLPYEQMDLCLYAINQGISVQEVAQELRYDPHQIERVFADIMTKRKTTRYLHLPAQLIEKIPEIDIGAE